MSRLSIRVQVMLLITALVIGTGFVYTVLLGKLRHDAMLSQVDARLMTAAVMQRAMDSNTFHNRIHGPESVSEAEYHARVVVNNAICRRLGLNYLWSVLVLDDDHIVFTSATSPGHDIGARDHAPFFSRHSDPSAFSEALRTMEPTYATFHNEWGHGRMLLLPARDSQGRVYIYGASIGLDELSRLVWLTRLSAVPISLLILVLALVSAVILARYLVKPLQALMAAAERIANGNLDTVIPTGGARETHALGTSFGVMRDAIRSRIEELRASEAKLAITLDSIGDAVVVTTLDGTITRMNPIAERLTGWPRNEANGQSLDTVLPLQHGDGRIPSVSPVEKVMRADGITTMDEGTILVARDGTRRRIADSGAPIRDIKGNIVGIVLVFRDITEQIEAQQTLRHAQKMQAIGELAGGIAHDFNNLLSVVMGNAQLLAAELRENKDLAEWADGIVRAAQRGSELTSQLLGFARKTKLQSVPTDVHAVITEVISLLRHGIDPRVEIIGKLEADRHIVNGDMSELQNAFLNLGVNARDAMPDGGVLVFATSNLSMANPDAATPMESNETACIEIRVCDTGCGMDAAVRERIFEPFFTTKGRGKGTGLGLSTAYAAIRGHGGLITVDSRPGHGSEFRIRIPVTDDAPAAADAPEDKSEGSTVAQDSVVMVVDDEKDIVTFIERVLVKEGYRVIACHNGREAVARFKEEHDTIDLVVLDQRMPEMSGWEAFNHMKKIDPYVPVIIASGYSHPEVVADLLAGGAVDYIAKPFDVNELTRKASQHARRRA